MDDVISSVENSRGTFCGGSKVCRLLRLMLRTVYIHRAFLTGVLSAFCFAVSAACVRALKDEVGSLELVFLRASFTGVTCLIYIVYRDATILKVSLEETKWHLIHAAVVTFSLCCQFYAYQNMRTADACAIVYCYVVFTGLFARIFLKEPFYLLDAVSFILSITGVIFIMQPTFLFGGFATQGTEVQLGLLPVLAAIAASIASAIGAVVMRLLARRQIPVWRMTLYFSLFGSAILFTPITVFKQWSIPKCYLSRAVCGLMGLFSFLGQLFLGRAMCGGNAFYISLALMSQVFFVFGLDTTIFGIQPKWLNALGILLIIASCVLATLYKVYLQKSTSPKTEDTADNREVSNRSIDL